MLRILPNRPWLRQSALAVVFVAVYLLMSVVIVEQGRTINSQQQLIHSLFQDSVELTHLKLHQLELKKR